jgi:hypothetical protein
MHRTVDEESLTMQQRLVVPHDAKQITRIVMVALIGLAVAIYTVYLLIRAS